ncbi:MAG TPA: hypothetical protein VMD55_04885, partial [Terracidiphilus sp.]|nr:hypothetical protein [Terracidiphilus sp.]
VCFSIGLACAMLLSGQSSRTLGELVYSSFPGEPAPSRDTLTAVVNEARWDTPRAGDQNPDDLRLRFEQIESQGTPGTAPARFRVFAEGAPDNKVYGLASWVVGQSLAYDPRDLYVNDQGLVMIHGPRPAQEAALTAPGDELELAPQAGTAEPVRYMLSSKDGALSIFGTLVPHPLITQDQDCTLELRIAQPHATAVLVVAEGFPPDARVPLVLESGGQTVHMTMATNSSGHAEVADFPSVPGKTQGSLKVTAEGPSCLPSAVLPWGAQPVRMAQ